MREKGGRKGQDSEEADEDGLSLAAIERRFERVENVNEWCKCGKCSVQNLVGAREYRCCWEVHPAFGKLTFDGSVDRIRCVTLHDEYIALSNRIVLKQVGPLLKDRQGRGYRRRGNQTENEYARAVAYRWLVRWIFGPMGWDNTRPLPACIYEEIRSRFPTTSLRGYATTEERD
ncbi:uncharacterized protein LOC135687538 [Rhopilema esculentum]|uniref:uncharacterized protein LOC135687538 n=1 Tax=Rhopilema esculentum TaxID=499914 RepID=UPI0031D35AC6